MNVEILIAFVFASVALLSIPGPTAMLVITYALRQGRSTALATVPGVMLGDFTAMMVSMAGAGAVLATSATLFTALKLVGAAYLVWLGIQLWRRPSPLDENTLTANEFTAKRMFWQAYVVTALNPKGILFFTAFVPQFLDTSRPMLSQSTILIATFLGCVAICTTIWALLASQMRERFRHPSMIKKLNRFGAGILMSAGVFTATVR